MNPSTRSSRNNNELPDLDSKTCRDRRGRGPLFRKRVRNGSQRPKRGTDCLIETNDKNDRRSRSSRIGRLGRCPARPRWRERPGQSRPRTMHSREMPPAVLPQSRSRSRPLQTSGLVPTLCGADVAHTLCLPPPPAKLLPSSVAVCPKAISASWGTRARGQSSGSALLCTHRLSIVEEQ